MKEPMERLIVAEAESAGAPRDEFERERAGRLRVNADALHLVLHVRRAVDRNCV